MDSKTIYEKYIAFFKEHGHKEIPNVSLVPQGDSTLLFVNCGMFPLAPYLAGEPHPLGKRLTNIQRSMRFDDLENVGETNRHTTAFHMLGNWSLGDYFKKEQLQWAYEFYIEVLGLDVNKIYATVFEGDNAASKDQESIDLLKGIFKKYGVDAKEEERIFAVGAEDNWWKRGDAVGELGGPTSEVFYYIRGDGNGFGKSPTKNQDDFIEIGNSVFMQYKKTETGWEQILQNNIDFGGGLERIALTVQGKSDIFQTDNFWPIIEKIQELSKKQYTEDIATKKAMCVLADHIRSSTFLAMDGVLPSNKDQGYVLRRFLRRMMRYGKKLGMTDDISAQLVPIVCNLFSWLYSELPSKQKEIQDIFVQEETKFVKTLKIGSTQSHVLIQQLKESINPASGVAQMVANKSSLGNIKEVSQKFISLATAAAFNLYQSYGYPHEMFAEDLQDAGLPFLDVVQFDQLVKEHQSGSRKGAEQKFKGGLADHSEINIRYHTMTHLLQAGLQKVLGTSVYQMGSNITNERLRFDFPHNSKLTDQEILLVEEFVIDIIKRALPVKFEMMSKKEAIELGACYLKNESYPDLVKVYYIGNNLQDALSKELCGGPHITNTSELTPIKIYKQDKLGKGAMRIYAKFV